MLPALHSNRLLPFGLSGVLCRKPRCTCGLGQSTSRAQKSTGQSSYQVSFQAEFKKKKFLFRQASLV